MKIENPSANGIKMPVRKNAANADAILLKFYEGLSREQLERAAIDQNKRIDELTNRDGATTNTDKGLPDLIDAADFLAAPIAPPPELIAGILHLGSKLVLGGGSKSYKTWVLLDLAMPAQIHGSPARTRE